MGYVWKAALSYLAEFDLNSRRAYIVTLSSKHKGGTIAYCIPKIESMVTTVHDSVELVHS